MKTFIFTIFSIFLYAGTTHSDTKASITGKVVDAVSLETLIGATVTIYQNGKPLPYGAVTNENGEYSLLNLDAGTYEIEFTSIGYTSFRQKDIKLNVGQNLVLNQRMNSSEILTDEVTVTASKYETPIRESTSSMTIKAKEIVSMPTVRSTSTVSHSSYSMAPAGKTAPTLALSAGARSDATDGGRTADKYMILEDKIRLSEDEDKKATSDVISGDDLTHKWEMDGEVTPVDEPVIVGGLPGVVSDTKSELGEKTKDAEKERKKEKAGQLTAGEICDFQKWALWEDLNTNEFKNYQEQWKITPKQRYMVQVIGQNKHAIVGVSVQLKSSKGEVLFEGMTDNTGKAELWLNLFNKTDFIDQKINISATVDGITETINHPKPFPKSMNTLIFKKAPCREINAAEIAFVVDATGSMGDEISFLQAELLDIIEKTRAKFDQIEVKFGSVFYQDHGDQYLTKHIELSTDEKKLMDFISDTPFGGGGDTPEALDDALEVAIEKLGWSDKPSNKIMFVILDAPPHQHLPNLAKLEKAILDAAKKGIRIIPVTCSGIDKSTEYLMRSMALATNGTYTFLTNHSGIGGHHIEPSTDKYKVEKANELLYRLICQFLFVDDCKKDVNALVEESANIEINPQFVPEQLIEAKIEVSCFPNPAINWIDFKTNIKLSSLILTDITGKFIMQFSDIENQKRIELGDLPSGVYYFIYESTLKHKGAIKFIIQG
jgi:Carboxypeptidase regulatory-like domain/von Willebrand factor type A domain